MHGAAPGRSSGPGPIQRSRTPERSAMLRCSDSDPIAYRILRKLCLLTQVLHSVATCNLRCCFACHSTSTQLVDPLLMCVWFTAVSKSSCHRE